jgi:hypothetical protein
MDLGYVCFLSSPFSRVIVLELRLQNKDSSSRQIGEVQKITGFRQNKDTELTPEKDLSGINLGEFRVLKLFYCGNLIQEKSYGKKRATAEWYQLN